MPRLAHDRRGFALLAVLWTVVGLSALALAGTVAARQALLASGNRRALARARWRAEDCLERARAAIDGALAAAAAQDGRGPDAQAWARLDRVVAGSPFLVGTACDVTLRAAGDAVDVNDADAEQLRRLFVALGAPAPRADSLADALLDWRDPDGEPRPLGAERQWYGAAGRAPPRDGPLADVRELARVRGFDAEHGLPPSLLDSVLTVEPGRVVLDRAPLAVVASLPGMTPEAVERVAEFRLRGQPTGELLAFMGALSRAARDSLTAHYPDLVRLTTPEPDAWLVTSRAREGVPEVTASVEVRLVRAGARAAVVRRRSVQ